MDQQQKENGQKMNFNISQEQQQYLKTGFNVFIIGFQATGKSTLANVISDQEQLYFEKEGTNYKPINKNYFPIAENDSDGTKEPHTIIMQDYQIWDLPGYGDREKVQSNQGHAAMDIYENRLQQIIICNQSQQSHIIIIFSYSEFSVAKGENIVQLCNLLAQKDLQASIIISRVPIKVKLQNLIQKLQEQLDQVEIKYSNEAKQFLNQVIQDKRFYIFQQPQLNGENYQFNKDNIDQIKQLVFDKKNFHKIQLKYRFLTEDKQLIDGYIEELQIQLKEMEQQIIDFTIKINNSIIENLNSDDQQQFNQQKQVLLQNKEKHLGYYEILQQVEQLKLQKWNEDNFKQQLKKINDFYQVKDPQINDQKLCVACASYKLSELKVIYNSNKSIKDIYICAIIQFIVDCDVEMPGVQIYIKTKKFRVIKQSFINLKGQSGQSILEKARDGDEYNINGDTGRNGSDGLAGGTFYVVAEEYQNIEQLTIDVSGGDGGKGQDGGDGFDGKKGEDGNENEVMLKKKNRVFDKCEEVPTNLFEDLFSANRVFHIYFRSQGQAGTVGGNAGGGGLGGATGPQGMINFENLNGEQLNFINNNSSKGFDGVDGTPGKGGQFGYDYVGQFQDAKFLGFLRKPKELKQQQKQEKLNKSQLETSGLSENNKSSLKQSSINSEILATTENVVGQAAIGGVGVGAGIAVREIGIQAATRIGLGAAGAAAAAGALVLLGLQAIATGADLVIRHGWNYIKKDEQNIKWGSSGQIVTQNDQQQKDDINNQEDRDNKQSQRLKYFLQFNSIKINQQRSQFNQLWLSKEQISRMIDQ